MNKTQIKNRSVGRVRPGRPARPAAARLRRAGVGPILARPPIRAIQPCVRPLPNGSATANSLAWRGQNGYEMRKNTGWF